MMLRIYGTFVGAAALAVALVLLVGGGALAQDAPPDPEPEGDGSVWEEVQRLYEKAREAGEKVPRDVYEWARQDFGNIGDWEYQVLELEEVGADALAQALNTHGKDRWECIWVQPAGERLRLILKRPARSYLRHLPLSQLLRLLQGGGSGDDGGS